MYKVAIFASGSGSNALKIIEHFSHSSVATVSLIITNRVKAGVLQHAKDFGVESHYFPGSVWRETPDEVLNTLSEAKIDFIVLAGFLLKVPSVIVSYYANKMLNIHPALLPKYGGKGMYGHHVHQAVKENKEQESGMTIHYVNDVYDDGQIVFQAKTELQLIDTADTIQKKVLTLEHKWFSQIIEQELKKLTVSEA